MSVDLPITDDRTGPLDKKNDDDFARVALEHLALDGYLAGSLSRYQVQRLLGFDNRWETEDWLGQHNAPMHYTTADLDLDRSNLDRVLGR